ncbi:hypothetical protein Ae201684_008448 [Aphanomyces euteiches]|uniref:Uncharacterized protein n=1 Tax=Aphanomyces euteiches TaxID=100861 RepID=A0A6G0X548_9STRA|nr:hypothetical protein Ae201684_008448 [Aphanomyces euteiches]
MMPTQQMKMNMLKRTLDYEADKENIPMFSTVTKDQFGLTEKRLIHDKLAGPSPYNAVKSNWTIEDEVKMKALVHEYGTKNWNEIALHFTNKSGRQCHERWKQMCESAVTPKKIGMTSGSFNFTKALAAMRKNLANNSSIKSTPPSIRRLSQTPGILGRSPAFSHGHSAAMNSLTSPRIDKVSKLNCIADKLKFRQEQNFSDEKSYVPNSPMDISHKRKIDSLCELYGVGTDEIEYRTFIRRPPPPPEGYMPRRILPGTKRQRIVETKTRSDSDFPWMKWTGNSLENSLLDMIEWRYPKHSAKEQIAAINKTILKGKRRLESK